MVSAPPWAAVMSKTPTFRLWRDPSGQYRGLVTLADGAPLHITASVVTDDQGRRWFEGDATPAPAGRQATTKTPAVTPGRKADHAPEATTFRLDAYGVEAFTDSQNRTI